MTDVQTMKAEVAGIIREELSDLSPISASRINKHQDPRYNTLREAILKAEKKLRLLIRGNETEVHEWLAVIHYALADERERLLGI